MEDARYYLEKDMGNNITRFYEDLKNMDFTKEFKYPDVDLYAIPLLDNLKIVGEQREAYAELLKFVGQNWNKEMLELATRLFSGKEHWGRIRTYFMKMVITRASKFNYELIKSYMENVRRLEEETFKSILKNR